MQELKAKQFEAELVLGQVADGGFFLADYGENNWCYSTLACKQSITLLSSGKMGAGYGVWIKTPTERGPVGIVNLYIPHEIERRRQVWEWLQQLTSSGRWIILGDMNMVEFAEDTNGSIAILHGPEERQWKRFCQERDVIDVYLTAAIREGPWYTRFQVKEDDVEMSRLDRMYLTDSGDWIDNIAKINHHTSSCVSDHFPVKVLLKLKEKAEEQRRWNTYFKASSDDLSGVETKQQVEEAWAAHPPSVEDPRIRWDLAWARVMRVLHDQRKKARNATPNKEELLKELEKWRTTLEADNSRENRAGFLLTREAIRALERDNGSVTEDPDEIIHEVGEFYTRLFQEEEEQEDAPQRRAAALGKVTARAPPELNRILKSAPDLQEAAWLLLELDHNTKAVNRRKPRSANKILLIEEGGRITKSRTLAHMIQGWRKAQPHLNITEPGAPRPHGLKINTILDIGMKISKTPAREWTWARRWLKKYRIDTGEDITETHLSLMAGADRNELAPCNGSVGPVRMAVHFLNEWFRSPNASLADVASLELWEWKPGEKLISWERSNQEWRTLLVSQYKRHSYLNRKWSITWAADEWGKLWKALWKALLFPREKLWLWQILQWGLFTGAKARQIGEDTRVCKRCNREEESIPHLFISCRRTRWCWLEIENLLSRVRNFKNTGGTIPQLLLNNLEQTPVKIVWSIAFVTHTRRTWKERCKSTYKQRESTAPVLTILQETGFQLTEIKSRWRADRTTEKIEDARNILSDIIECHRLEQLTRHQRWPQAERALEK
ncbi:hypothetical protein R1sor_006462 [Riccia sorocarpa]|uniref:Reverse transcriptase zinc-binding domain-containing protein n=1 Tax=Riccia sorocarpa TaxID=122646 RepID=A0ABD3HPR0_9MARC